MASGYGTVGTTKSPYRIPVNLTLEDLDIKPDVPDGVTIDRDKPRAYRYRAQGCYQGKKYYLGRYDTPEEAGEVYRRFRADPAAFLASK